MEKMIDKIQIFFVPIGSVFSKITVISVQVVKYYLKP